MTLRTSPSTTTPPILDFSYLSNILELGDLVEYKLRRAAGSTEESHLKMTATVIGIRLEEDGITTTAKLDNGDKLVNSLHLVRRVSMRTIGTSEPIWNPILDWKELSNMYMNPNEFAEQPCEDTSEEHAPTTNEPVGPVMNDQTKQSKAKLDYKRGGSHQNSKSQSVRNQAYTSSKRLGDVGRRLHWMKDPMLSIEV